jgi:VWFA-related protein
VIAFAGGQVLPTLSLLAAGLLAQAPPPRFPSGTDIVRLDVLAREGQAPLPGLHADDFEVRDNGVLQKVLVSPATSSHWRMLVLLDTSESVNGRKLEAFRACARAIAGTLREGDEAALVTFADRVVLRSDLTTSAALLRQPLDRLRAGGSTALFDAVFAALALPAADSFRPLVILLTDGRDTASWLSADDVVEAAGFSDATIYAVSTSERRRSPLLAAERPTWAAVARGNDEEVLARITRQTGGRLLRADSATRVQEQVAAMLDEIAARYILAYEPQGVVREGRHQVEVRLRGRSGDVVVRPGYYVVPPRDRR